MARDGKIIQRQHFFHQTQFAIQSQVTKTTKLHGTSTCESLDATIMRCFQAELFSRFLPPPYAGHVNLAGEKP